MSAGRSGGRRRSTDPPVSGNAHRSGLEVDDAKNGEEALEKVREQGFDSAVDMNMPGLGGFETPTPS